MARNDPVMLNRKIMDRNTIRELVEEAFKLVKLENGVGLYEAEAIDNYASEGEILEAKERDRKSWEEWNQIPALVISTFYTVLNFVDPKGMKFLLPAYMVFTIDNYDKTHSVSIDSVIYALGRGKEGFGRDDAVLTIEQKKVIAKFLEYMVVEAGDYCDSTAASIAYENHWSQYQVKE